MFRVGEREDIPATAAMRGIVCACWSPSPATRRLRLPGPPAVDSAYQVFVNGKLLGSAGRFSGQVVCDVPNRANA